MSEPQEVSKMVGVYKKLFTFLIVLTLVGMGVAFLHIPLWVAVVISMIIIVVKSGVLLDAFKGMLVGRHAITLLFGLTIFFFAGLLVLPLWTHQGSLLGTVDIGKEYQLANPPAAHEEKEAKDAHGH